MSFELKKQIDLLIQRYPSLKECEESILDAYFVLENCFKTNHKLLIAGNGGSCADSEHIVGELMKSFKLPRKCSNEYASKLISIDSSRGKELSEKLQGGLMSISLTNHQALNTAYINDVSYGGNLLFAEQIYNYGKPGDVFLAISTSGNSENILYATIVARASGLKIIGLTGQQGGELAKISDVTIKAPSTETYLIQELHLPIYHFLCLMLEERFFGK